MPAKSVPNSRHRDLRLDKNEAKPEPSALPQDTDNLLASSLRRVPNVAVYTLAALGAQSLSQQVIATTNVDVIDQPQVKEAGDLVTPAQKEETETTEVAWKRSHSAIAAPESPVVQEFTPESTQASASPTAQPTAVRQEIAAPAIAAPESSGVQEFTPESTQASALLTTQPTAATQEIAASSAVNPTPIAATTGIAAPETEVMLAQRTTLPEERTIPTLPPPASPVELEAGLSDVPSYRARDLQEAPALESSAARPQTLSTSVSQATSNPLQTQNTVAGTSTPTKPCPETGTLLAQALPGETQTCSEVDNLQNQLRDLENLELEGEFRASPALSIVIPTAFGADNNTGFISATYQNRTRYSDVDDGGLGIGIGLGDAREAVGVELSYAIASFGSNRDFGSGGFNVKVHRQLPNDFAVAVGWNGFLNIGDDNDFEDSIYGVVSKVIRTRDDINLPFSRVALTAGVGTGQFQSEDDFADDSDGINVFGNIAVRVAEPVSVIAEWSGQDLGVGLSIAPFKNIPLVITPALRDITGAGDGARFVLGTGFAFKF